MSEFYLYFLEIRYLARNKLMRKKTFTFFALLAASIVGSGCSDTEKLRQARGLANLTSEFSAQSSEISQDIYYSCLRRVGYLPIDNPNIRSVRATALEECENVYKPAWRQAEASGGVLVEYMTALIQVAGVDFDSTQDLNRIKTVLSFPGNEKFGLSENTLEAGFGIIGFLLNTSVRRMQVEGLTQPIVCTNDDIQAYTQGLAQAFQLGYIDGVLVEEESRFTDYYSTRALIMRSEGSGAPLDFQVLEERLAEAMEEVAGRKIAGENYIQMLETIAQKHNELAANFRAEGRDINCSEMLKGELSSKDAVQSIDENLAQQILSEYKNEMLHLSREFDDNWPE